MSHKVIAGIRAGPADILIDIFFQQRCFQLRGKLDIDLIDKLNTVLFACIEAAFKNFATQNLGYLNLQPLGYRQHQIGLCVVQRQFNVIQSQHSYSYLYIHTRSVTGRPGPLEVEPPQVARHIQNFANKIEAGLLLSFHSF